MESQGPRTSRHGVGLVALVEAMRPAHWVKNAFVVAPILFSWPSRHAEAWLQCALATAAYCLLSSSVYLINDLADRDADRLHPTKRDRAIASGRLGAAFAMSAAAILMLAGLGLAVLVDLAWRAPGMPLGGMQLIVWTLSYLALNLLYSFWLKGHAVVDVIVVALGFVLRAMAGAAAINVPITPWLVVCTFTLTLFIALTKRRSELLSLSADESHGARKANRGYSAPTLEYMLTVSTALAILTYSLYCLAPGTIMRIGSGHMIWTIPLVVYGMFRFNAITRQSDADPTALLVRDKTMWVVVGLYVTMVLLIYVFGRDPSVSNILDTHWELHSASQP